MVQCEMCGAETPAPKTVKIEGAELQVCDDCAEFGTEVQTTDTTSTSTKYSTGSSGTTGTSGQPKSGSSSGGRRHDMFDEMEELAEDYDQRLRQGRERADLTQEELANSINEKVSLIRKIEHGDMLPSDDVQGKLERKLDVSLTESVDTGEDDWEGGGTDSGLTLGDMVERRD